MPTATRDTVIRNKLGLHARPAMQFVELANGFRSDIKVQTLAEPPMEADGKSVMQMIILAAVEGTPIRISAAGDDAQLAVEQLAAMIDSKFGEED
jgi:phosphocarrier protein HPr